MKPNGLQTQSDNNQTTERLISRELYLTGQAIYVIWLREMKRFFRAKSRLIGNLAMPFFFLFAMGFGFRAWNMPGAFQGVNYFNFLTPGIIGMTILFSSMFTGLSALWDKEFGFLKEIMVAPVRRSVVIFGRIAGGVTTNLIQGTLILIISFFMGFEVVSPFSFLLAVFFMALTSIGFNGLSIAIASKMEDIQGFPLIMHFFTYPCFLLSGALFPINNFPNWIKPLSLINPLTYGVDSFRAILINSSQFPLFLDLTVLLVFGSVTVILGSYLFNKTEV